MSRYDDLGMRRVINASATLTRLGGSVMPPSVVAAMAEGAEMHVDLPLLQVRVGERIAALTQNEACYVSCGAAAGIAIAVAACIAGEDPAAIARFPYLTDGKREVIIHRAHRNGYDHAARQTGATLVEIGGAHITHPWELEAAISPRTACILWFAGEHYARGALALPEVVAIARTHGVPVLVDAAAQIPPISNLWHFTREIGADIAIFSGGKGLRGPQSSGLVLGRADIVAACRVNGSPNHSLGRPMKVGKEETLGVLAAIEWSLAQNEEAVLARYEEIVQGWIAGLRDLPSITVERGYPSEAGQPHARAIIRLAPDFPMRRDQVVATLYNGTPCIAVGTVGNDAIALNPQPLVEPDEATIVLEQVRAVLAPVAVR